MKTKIANGFHVNPSVPEWMDSRSLSNRSESHLEQWYLVPYIQTESFSKETYVNYRDRMKKVKVSEVLSKEAFEQWMNDWQRTWWKKWPAGVRYDVRCLDGGAEDRTTNHGSYDTLDKALAKCQRLVS